MNSTTDNSEILTIEFNYHARGFCCPNCSTGLSLTSTKCPHCGSKLRNPYEEASTNDRV